MILLRAINGSAAHKVYPYTQIVSAWLMEHTNVHIFLLADEHIGNFFRAMDHLGVIRAHDYPRMSQFIKEIIVMPESI